MSRRTYAAFVLLALLLAALWLLAPREVPRDVRLNAPSTSRPAPSQSAIRNPQSEIAPAPAPAAGAASDISHLAATLNSPAHDTHADLRVLDELVATFRSNFPREGNPTGTNAEITAALTGRNKLSLALLARDHPAINRDGELCDRWGTPFFFHAETATRTTYRSAGPDRKLWTADDIAFEP